MNPHADVGAYLLGALDDDEMSRFEEHLAYCDDCGRELDELSGVLPVLAELKSDGIGYVAPPGDALLARLLGQVRGERSRHRRRRLLSVAAAMILVVGGPAVAVVISQDGGGSTAATQTVGEQHQATNTVTGVWASVGVTGTAWGTSLDVKVTGVTGPRTCYLEAISKDSTIPSQTASTWWVPPAGYGTAAQPKALSVQGATGLTKDKIARYDIRDSKGNLLVSIPGDNSQPADRPRSSD
ncbi:MAG: hypothetical protein QOF98_3548 [Streptomyces sp.]|nr:hypothetical protein [Streptomyces sp.]